MGDGSHPRTEGRLKQDVSHVEIETCQVQQQDEADGPS